MNDDNFEILLIQNSIDLLTDFFQVISDGYNQVSISMTISLNMNLDERKYFVLPGHLGGNNQDYFKSIDNTRQIVESIRDCINQNFQRCLDHLVCFSYVPTLFNSKFHFDNLKAAVNKVQDRLIKEVEHWNADACEYAIGPERKILIVHGYNRSIAIEFGTHIH